VRTHVSCREKWVIVFGISYVLNTNSVTMPNEEPAPRRAYDETHISGWGRGCASGGRSHPKEIRILLRVGASDGAVGEDDLHIEDVIERETPHAREGAFPADGGMAADADLGTRPVRDGASALVLEFLRDLAQTRAAADGRLPGILVDADGVERGQVDDEGAVGPAEGVRSEAVSAGAGLDADAEGRGGADGEGDVLRGAREDDREGFRLATEVPGTDVVCEVAAEVGFGDVFELGDGGEGSEEPG
jgi:hypothetical protein